MDKQKTKRAAPQLAGRAAARLMQLWKEEHLHTLMQGVQRFVLCAVLARGTVLGGYAPFGLAMAAALMARGAGLSASRRADLRGDAAGRRAEKRRICGRGPARAMRDERVRGPARGDRAVVCTCGRCARGRGVHLCVSARRPGASGVGRADLCRCAGADVWRVPGVRRGARPAAGRERLETAGDPARACRDRAALAVRPRSVRPACARARARAAAGAGGGLPGRFGSRGGGGCGIRRGDGSVRGLRGALFTCCYGLCALVSRACSGTMAAAGLRCARFAAGLCAAMLGVDHPLFVPLILELLCAVALFAALPPVVWNAIRQSLLPETLMGEAARGSVRRTAGKCATEAAQAFYELYLSMLNGHQRGQGVQATRTCARCSTARATACAATACCAPSAGSAITSPRSRRSTM